MKLLLVLIALLIAVPAEAGDLTLQQKTMVMNLVRQRLKDPTAKFRWLPMANTAFYCALVMPARSVSYLPFQLFGMSGKKWNVVVASDKTTTASVRQSCERYGYNFTQAAE